MSKQEAKARYWAEVRTHKAKAFLDGVPKKYRNAQLTDFPYVIRTTIREWLTCPFPWLLYIQGSVGRGKTHLAFATALAWTTMARADKCGAVWWAVPDLLAKMRRQFDQPGKDVVSDLQASPGLLILDDLGAEKDTEYAIQELYRIVYMREAEDLKTVITSNYLPGEIGAKLSERIMSRLASGEILKLRGQDRRMAR